MAINVTLDGGGGGQGGREARNIVIDMLRQANCAHACVCVLNEV